MKRSLLIVALAAVLVLAFVPAAFAIGPFFTGTYNAVYTGTGEYLDWDASATLPGNSGSSPHGNYSASSNKCAVCHSVHMATAGKAVLTAGPDDGTYTNYSEGCAFCHSMSNTFTNVKVVLQAGGIAPHASVGCEGCHAANPHGVGTSAYAVKSSRLLNTVGDAQIAAELLANTNGVTANMFDASVPANDGIGITLATGYLCGQCHLQAYAVNTYKTDPQGGGAFTGHRVYALNTANWDQAAAGGSYSGAAPVAYAPATGCATCHDAVSGAVSAFPHNYVDSTGVAVATSNTAGAGYIWLNRAGFLTDTKVLQAKTGVVATDLQLLTDDGLCLKCHRGTAANGVGFDF